MNAEHLSLGCEYKHMYRKLVCTCIENSECCTISAYNFMVLTAESILEG